MEEKILLYVSAMEEFKRVGNKLIGLLLKKKANKNKNILILVFTRKVTRLIEALCLLIAEDYDEEAQILARGLLETKFSFDYIIQNKKDYEQIYQRYIYSLFLDKLKQIYSTNEKIYPDIKTRKFYQNIEKNINSHYSKDEIKKLKSHGFTEMTVKDLADATGNTELYNLAYRLYSRNTHLTDGNEHLMQLIRSDQDFNNYKESRFKMLMEVIFLCAQPILKGVNAWIGNPIKLPKK